MKRLINYLAGKVQFAPMWIYKLPRFFRATYTGKNSFRWFGIEFKTPYGMAGDTLFMAWRERKRGNRPD